MGGLLQALPFKDSLTRLISWRFNKLWLPSYNAFQRGCNHYWGFDLLDKIFSLGMIMISSYTCVVLVCRIEPNEKETKVWNDFFKISWCEPNSRSSSKQHPRQYWVEIMRNDGDSFPVCSPANPLVQFMVIWCPLAFLWCFYQHYSRPSSPDDTESEHHMEPSAKVTITVTSWWKCQQ